VHEEFDQNQQKNTEQHQNQPKHTKTSVLSSEYILTNIAETSKPNIRFNLVHIKEISELPSMFKRLQVAEVRQLVWQILK